MQSLICFFMENIFMIIFMAKKLLLNFQTFENKSIKIFDWTFDIYLDITARVCATSSPENKMLVDFFAKSRPSFPCTRIVN